MMAEIINVQFNIFSIFRLNLSADSDITGAFKKVAKSLSGQIFSVIFANFYRSKTYVSKCPGLDCYIRP